jgi:hypothetical protein
MKKILPWVAIVLAGAALIVVLPQRAKTQSEVEPENIMGMMGPMMSQMMDAMTESMLSTMAKPETTERLATFARNYHDALVAKGFSEEEAIKILTSVGMPSFPSMN